MSVALLDSLFPDLSHVVRVSFMFRLDLRCLVSLLFLSALLSLPLPP